MSLALVLRPLDASGKGTPPPLTETNGSRSATHTCARWSMMTVGELAERVGDLGGDLARPCREVPATHLVGSATGGFAFRRAMDKAGRPAGYDANQTAIVSVTKGGRYAIEK